MEETTSEVIGDLLHFLKIMALICGVSVIFALGIAYGLHVIKSSPLSETFIAVLGGMGILLMITGALGAANAPAKTLSRGETSRTHIQEMKKMRSLSNPLFAPGLSVFLSGAILGSLAYFLR